jgi:hemoglobin/transferrin/lactoferrin receptor protein
LAAYELNVNNTRLFNNIRSIISYQHIEESRHQREYRRYDRLDNRLEDIGVWNITLDGRKLWNKHELTVGLDVQLNDVKSEAYREDILTGSRSTLDTRYPNGKNKMNYYGAYVQHILKFNGGKLILNDGIRAQAVQLHSRINDNSIFKFPFTEIKQDNLAVTGNLGLVYLPDDKLRLTMGISSGFRAPNIDDASRIFESSNSQLIVPNPDIEPEYTYNIDLGITKNLADFLRIELNGFHTWFNNAIALAPFQLNGQEFVTYNNANVQVLANQNINKAVLYGVNASTQATIKQRLTTSFAINFTKGHYKADANKFSTVFVKRSDGSYIDSSIKVSKKPLDHIPPMFGKFSVQYHYSKLQMETYMLFNGWKRIKDFYATGEDNPQYAAPNGFISGQIIPDGYPSWLTLNFKTSFQLNKHFMLQAGIENILDRNYRYFASGFSAPGRNIIIAVRSNF